MPIAVTTEQLAMAASVDEWARRAATIASVRELETTGGRTAKMEWAAGNWAALSELGVFSVALPTTLGGAGGTTVDVAVTAEQLAEALAPGPLLPTLLAGLVLAKQTPANPALADIGAGSVSVAAALSVGGLTATRTPAGGLRVTGTASLVLGGGDSSHLLLGAETETGETWFMLDGGNAQRQERSRLHVAPRAPVDFSRALADVTLTDLEVAPEQVLTGVRAGLVTDLAIVLATAEASGVAAWCVRMAASYARTRHQFGRPIGSFQAIKHLCAAMLCRSEQAAAIAAAAAAAADQAPGELPLAAAATAALALDAAVDNAKDAIQVLGGIGFTWEHDAHLFLRRALALRQLLGGSARWRARAAELALEGMRRRQALAPSGRKENPATADRRRAARLVAAAVSAVPPERQRHALAEVGYVAPGWPKPYGLAASPPEQMVIDEELAAAGVTRPDLAIGGWAIPAIASHGPAAQLKRFAEATLRGDITWCQLFSEPEAGSDLASLRTRAVRTAGGWLLTGQKVWTSLAGQADWAICLARTDPAAPKHEGITFFLVQMRSPGIEIRPLREMTGRQMFNQVFLDEVFVPDDCVVGEPGDGWRIARTTLATERVAMSRGSGLSEEIEGLLAAAPGGLTDDPALIDQVGARVAECLALSALDDRLDNPPGRGAAWTEERGAQRRATREGGASKRPGSGGSGGSPPRDNTAVRKLLGVAHRQATAETALTLCGARGAAADGAAATAVHDFLLSRCLSIAGGTSQILLTLVAERCLLLPRQEAR